MDQESINSQDDGGVQGKSVHYSSEFPTIIDNFYLLLWHGLVSFGTSVDVPGEGINLGEAAVKRRRKIL